MSITRRLVALGVNGRSVTDADALPLDYVLTNGHVLELRARARRANLIVSTREEPKRPEPRQSLWDEPSNRRVDGVQAYAETDPPAAIVSVGGVPIIRHLAHLRVATR